MTTALLFLSAIMAVVVWWLVRPTLNVSPWIERSTIQTARGNGEFAHGAGASRTLGVSRRRHVAVRAADQRLPHANDGGRLDRVEPAARAVAQHRCARARQRRHAVDARQCAKGRDGRGEKRPARRRRIHLRLSGGAALGVATIECLGGVHAGQSGVRVLPAAHGVARHPLVGRPVGLGQGDRQGRCAAPRWKRFA